MACHNQAVPIIFRCGQDHAQQVHPALVSLPVNLNASNCLICHPAMPAPKDCQHVVQAKGAPDGDDQGPGAPVSHYEESNLIIIPVVKHDYFF